MRGRKNPGPVVSRSVRRAMLCVGACTTELAKAAMRNERQRITEEAEKRRETLKAQRAKNCMQVPGVGGIKNETEEVERLNEIEAEFGGENK